MRCKAADEPGQEGIELMTKPARIYNLDERDLSEEQIAGFCLICLVEKSVIGIADYVHLLFSF